MGRRKQVVDMGKIRSEKDISFSASSLVEKKERGRTVWYKRLHFALY